MADRYWTREEVEALIPTLTEIMTRVKQGHAEATEIRERLQDEKRRIAMSGGAMVDAAAWRKERAQLDRSTEDVRAGVNRIVELGGVPKDLDMGLVDFIHLREGAEANFCWKHGETKIRYWHGLDEGFSGRKAL